MDRLHIYVCIHVFFSAQAVFFSRLHRHDSAWVFSRRFVDQLNPVLSLKSSNWSEGSIEAQIFHVNEGVGCVGGLNLLQCRQLTKGVSNVRVGRSGI